MLWGKHWRGCGVERVSGHARARKRESEKARKRESESEALTSARGEATHQSKATKKCDGMTSYTPNRNDARSSVMRSMSVHRMMPTTYLGCSDGEEAEKGGEFSVRSMSVHRMMPTTYLGCSDGEEAEKGGEFRVR